MKKLLFLLYILSAQNPLLAQFSDDFSDGDFTTAPSWAGSNSGADFTIFSNQLRSNSTTTNSNLYLSTASSMVSNCQWEFWCNLQFNTSSANYVDVYLISDQANLQSASINGYFVRIGNTLDEICLYKRTGTTASSVKIIDGVDGLLNTSNNTMKIKVTRTSANLFMLERDLSGAGNSYFSEGTITDNTITTSTNFGVFIQQSTASFTQKHFFDNFYVGPIITDTTAPTLTSVNVNSSTQLNVLFSEIIDTTSAKTLLNYVVNNGIGSPSIITRDSVNHALVHLTFSIAFTSGLQNTITINNILDTSGNAMALSNANFIYYNIGSGTFGDVIINEIMADPNPTVGQPSVEYVELYNRSSQYFNLNGWKITDNATTGTINSNYLLAPNSYALITALADTALFTGISNRIGVGSFPSLNDAGDNIYVKNNSGTSIDSVHYYNTWYNNAVKKNGGWSLELINPNPIATCSVSSNWSATNDTTGGTPGKQNSIYSIAPDVTAPHIISITVIDSVHIMICFDEAIDATQLSSITNYSINNGIGVPIAASSSNNNTCVTLTLASQLISLTSYTVTCTSLSDCSGNIVSPNTSSFNYIQIQQANYKDIIINEIFADPTPTVALPTSEYVELYNKSSKYINLQGLKFTDNASTATLPNYVFAPNTYVILLANADTANFSAYSNKIGLSSFPSLNDAGDHLYLKTSTNYYIDSVIYSSAWYKDPNKSGGGWSLELINPNPPAACPLANNWIASNDTMGGTPGAQNSVYSIAPDNIAPLPTTVSIIDSLHITLSFNEAIDHSLVASASNYSINNGIGVPVLAADTNNSQSAILTLASPLVSLTSYIINFPLLSDCSGNLVSPSSLSFNYTQLQQAAFNDIIINEIFADPSPTVGLPSAEYVELYNKSTKYINLQGLKFTDNSSTATLPYYIFAPNTYVILLANADTANFSNHSNKIGLGSFPSLNDAADHVYLKTSGNTYIDSVNYSSSWYNDPTKKNGGWSLELINPNPHLSCPLANNWIASNDTTGGTPGVQNSVYSTAPDVASPQVQSVNAIDSTHIIICFNEAIDLTKLLNLASYNVNNGIGTPVLATDTSNEKCVVLTLANPLVSQTNYTINFPTLSDCSGNLVTPSSITFNYLKVEQASYKDIIINEIFADPSPTVSLPSAEYVELYNKSTKYISLYGLKFTDSSSTSNLPNYVFAPNSYLVLLSNADTSSFTAYPNKIGLSSFPSLNDSHDHLYLINSTNNFIDSVSYSSTWYNDPGKKNGGWSLELINPNPIAACSVAANWSASNDTTGGTPGTKNSIYSIAPDTIAPHSLGVTVIDSTHILLCFSESIDATKITNSTNYTINNGIGSPVLAVDSSNSTCVALTLPTPLISLTNYLIAFSLSDCSGNNVSPTTSSFTFIQQDQASYKDIIINEIFADPSPTVGLPVAEYIELYNKSSKHINLQGLKLTDSSSTATLPNYILAPNTYITLLSNSDTASFAAYSDKIGLSSFPSLNDSHDHLYLIAPNNTFIDSVTYSSAWYNDPNKKNGGWSLELINPNPNAACPAVINWTASNDTIGGTPGAQNSVYSTVPDITSPQPLSVNIIDSTHITVCFNEQINSALLSTAINYSINNSIGNPLSASVSSNGMCVDLFLAHALISQNNYTLSFSSLSDCSGNMLNPSTINFSFYIPKINDVVINEIMCDPDPPIALPDYEYIELYNKTAHNISIKNWSIATPTTTKTIPDITIAADSFVVLTGTSGFTAYSGMSLPVYLVSGFPSLANTASTLILRNEHGTLMNTISYNDTWYQDAAKSEGGFSLEMIDPNNPCAGENNWSASNNSNGGTPGNKNSIYAANPDNTTPQLDRISVISNDSIQLYFNESLDSLSLIQNIDYNIDNNIGHPKTIIPVGPDFKTVKLKIQNTLLNKIIYTCAVTNINDCAGNTISSYNSAQFAIPEPVQWQDLVINEIMYEPKDNGKEWIEIYNRSNKTIDLADVLVGKYDTMQNIVIGTKQITDQDYLIFPNEYIVISNNGATIRSQYYTPDPDGFIDIPSFPALSTSDVISISDKNLTAIDYVKYNSKMHFSLLNDTKGVSLERIDFNRESNDRTNWNSASVQVGFATPAYRNSQYLQADGGSTVSTSPEIFSPDNDGYNDVVNINYEFAEAGKAGNISIYDSRGRLIKYLVKNEILGIKGTYSWNGITQENEKAPIGIYIIYFETFDIKGKVEKYKLTTVLAGKL